METIIMHTKRMKRTVSHPFSDPFHNPNGEKTCLDCLHCKMIENRTRLSCSEGQWIDYKGNSKTIKLNDNEIKWPMVLPRKIFVNVKKECLVFNDMDRE